jgi:hypothetical protein
MIARFVLVRAKDVEFVGDLVMDELGDLSRVRRR